MLNDWFGIALVFVLVLINGFFVAAEFSLVSVRPTRIAERVARGDARAAAVQRVTGDPTRFIAATQLGITLASLGLGWIGEPALAHLIEPLFEWLPGEIAGTAAHVAAAGVLAFILITGMHVIVGELMPKSIALQRAERTALLVARPTLWVVRLFRPFIWALNGIGNFLLRLLGFDRASEQEHLHSVEELRMLVDASEEGGVIEAQESEMIHAVFDFGEMTAHQMMVPRTEMITLEVDTPIGEVCDFAAQHQRNKYPVHENDLDHIVGILHVKDLVPAMRLPPDRQPALRQLMREPLAVPDTIGVNDLLARFRQRKQHIAILLDEYGGTAGIVTLQDIMDELVGEVSDVFGPDEPEVQKLPDGRVRLDGLMLLTDFNDQFAVDLKDPNYETVAGHVMGKLDRIPKVGDEIDVPINDHEALRLRVEVMDGKRIAWIVMSRVSS
ncbi:MAG TPA: hemolysin family protein [Anaerolineae bacterium]|nr:hemolysin family protein [Anaerolineae bacterium]